ncbi:MAG: hypothetical protein MR269_02835 [Clostridiales bacterium]|nr:hypothetical protein [Clostridiales bacterium]
MKPQDERKPINLRVPMPIYEEIKKSADQIGISTHEMIMTAIDFYLCHKKSRIDG